MPSLAGLHRGLTGRLDVAALNPLSYANGYPVVPTLPDYYDSPGFNGDYASTPDNPAAGLTGDLEFVGHLAMDAWTGSGFRDFLSKFNTGQRSYIFRKTSGDDLAVVVSTDGIGASSFESTVPLTFTPGEPAWIRITCEVGGNTNFYTGSNGVDWTPLGAPVPGYAGCFDGTADVLAGSSEDGSSNVTGGRIYQLSLRAGIGGPRVVDFDPGGQVGETSWESSLGNIWTLHGNTSVLPAP